MGVVVGLFYCMDFIARVAYTWSKGGGMQDIKPCEVTTEEVHLPNAYEAYEREVQTVEPYVRPWIYIFASILWEIAKLAAKLAWMFLVLCGYIALLLWEYIVIPGMWGIWYKMQWMYYEWGIPLFIVVRRWLWD